MSLWLIIKEYLICIPTLYTWSFIRNSQVKGGCEQKIIRNENLITQPKHPLLFFTQGTSVSLLITFPVANRDSALLQWLELRLNLLCFVLFCFVDLARFSQYNSGWSRIYGVTCLTSNFGHSLWRCLPNAGITNMQQHTQWIRLVY